MRFISCAALALAVSGAGCRLSSDAENDQAQMQSSTDAAKTRPSLTAYAPKSSKIAVQGLALETLMPRGTVGGETAWLLSFYRPLVFDLSFYFPGWVASVSRMVVAETKTCRPSPSQSGRFTLTDMNLRPLAQTFELASSEQKKIRVNALRSSVASPLPAYLCIQGSFRPDALHRATDLTSPHHETFTLIAALVESTGVHFVSPDPIQIRDAVSGQEKTHLVQIYNGGPAAIDLEPGVDKLQPADGRWKFAIDPEGSVATGRIPSCDGNPTSFQCLANLYLSFVVEYFRAPVYRGTLQLYEIRPTPLSVASTLLDSRPFEVVQKQYQALLPIVDK